MKPKRILAALAVALTALAQPASAAFTHNDKGEATHYNGIPLPPIQTFDEAKAQALKEIAAKQARETQQADQLATRHPSPATPPQEVFYTGKPYLEETGQYLFLFRHYDPELSRWTTADPSGFPDGPNNQFYAPIPTNAFDPFGLWSATDYAWHYFWGKDPYQKGETVDLSVTGDLDAVVALANQHGSGPVAFQNSIEMVLLGKVSSRYMGAYVDATTKSLNIDYESVVFALGNSILRLNASYAFTGQQLATGYAWQYMAEFTYSIDDAFVDALDLFDWFPGNQDHPFGQSFSIVGTWGHSLQGSGLYE